MSKNFNPISAKAESKDIVDNLVMNHRPEAIIRFLRTIPKPL
jgi:hypothetical protein